MGGYWLVIRHQQQALKREMKRQLQADPNLQGQAELQFALQNGIPVDNNFSWEEEEEFSWNGKMYDIIEQHTVRNILTIRCIQDIKEKELLKKFCELEKQQDGKSGKNKSIVQLISGFVFEPVSTPESFLIPKFSLQHVEHYLSLYTLFDKEIITPPPRYMNA